MTIAFNQNKKGIFFFSIICGILILIDDIIHFNPKIEYAIFIENILAFVAIGLSSLATIKYKMLKEQSENRREEKIKAIKQMLFMTSHRLRQPICNIQGLGMLLDNNELSTQELREISSYLKDSIAKLDIYSKELTDFLSNIKEEEEM